MVLGWEGEGEGGVEEEEQREGIAEMRERRPWGFGGESGAKILRSKGVQ